MKAWSYSALKTFTQCPKKYYHLRVLKDVQESYDSPHLVYGNEVHKVLELYVRDGVAIPDTYTFLKPIAEAVQRLPGVKHCELKLGLKNAEHGYAAEEFFGPDVWWRGVADLVSVDGDRAFLIDYKTGKNFKYADPEQLDMLAAAIFAHFPDVEEVKSALSYVVTNDMLKKKHTRKFRKSYIAAFEPELDRIEAAEESGVWNANPSGLCRFCPVTSCPHNPE